MTWHISEKFDSLKFRILGGIMAIFVLAMGMVMYGVWTYQRDRLLEMSSRRAMNLSDVIVAGLRFSMLQNDRSGSLESINTILDVAGASRISILNAEGGIVLSTDPTREGLAPDRSTHPSCRACHQRGSGPGRTVLAEHDGEKYIKTATVIRNEPACYACHDSGVETIGVLLVESSFQETAVMLEQMEHRIALTGFFALVVGMLLVNSIVTRFFVRPLDILQKGFEQIGRGNFDHWVYVKSGGELGYMADSFNVMSRALGRFVRELKERQEEVAAHYTIVNSLSRTIEKKVLKEVVLDLLANLLKAEGVAMALSVEKYPNIFEVARIRRGDKRHYHSHCDTEKDDFDLCPLNRENLLSWARGDLDKPLYLEDDTWLLLPLRHEKFSIGLLSVLKAENEVFSRAEKKIVPILAHHISVALANAQLYDMAITDSLTTLYTKRYFEKKIRDCIVAHHSTRRGFCLLMIDIDYFKAVNDEHGHPVGDHVLMRFGELIRARIRHGDLPFRYGGEEFVVLLREDRLEDARHTAERIRRGAEQMVLRVGNVAPFTKTVSIGVACFPRHCTDADELVEAADRAMYKAKQMGRNRVVVFCERDGFAQCR